MVTRQTVNTMATQVRRTYISLFAMKLQLRHFGALGLVYWYSEVFCLGHVHRQVQRMPGTGHHSHPSSTDALSASSSHLISKWGHPLMSRRLGIIIWIVKLVFVKINYFQIAHQFQVWQSFSYLTSLWGWNDKEDHGQRVSLCSLQIIALKSVCLFRYSYKTCPC